MIVICAILLGSTVLTGCGIEHRDPTIIEEFQNQLPPDFPETVPLFDGVVVSSTRSSEPGWILWFVTMTTQDADPIGAVRDQLTGAGFSLRQTDSQIPDLSAVNGHFAVAVYFSELEVSGLGHGSGTAIVYTVETR